MAAPAVVRRPAGRAPGQLGKGRNGGPTKRTKVRPRHRTSTESNTRTKDKRKLREPDAGKGRKISAIKTVQPSPVAGPRCALWCVSSVVLGPLLLPLSRLSRPCFRCYAFFPSYALPHSQGCPVCLGVSSRHAEALRFVMRAAAGPKTGWSA